MMINKIGFYTEDQMKKLERQRDDCVLALKCLLSVIGMDDEMFHRADAETLKKDFAMHINGAVQALESHGYDDFFLKELTAECIKKHHHYECVIPAD